MKTIKDIMLISPGKPDNIILQYGCCMLAAFKDRSLVGRIIREVIYRVPFIPEKLCYSKEVLNYDKSEIIVYDATITKKYLLWLMEKFPNSNIHFFYCNKIGYANHLKPDEIPKGISIWTYDEYDANKFGINYSPSSTLLKKQPHYENPSYDVFFIGKDKGRGEYLLDLQNKLNKMGIRTKFIITADGRLSRRKKYYSKYITYEQVLEYDKSSKAIVNIIMPTQVALTVRDFEAISLDIKLITNNIEIIKYDFYHPENIFILGRDNLNDLPKFLDTPVIPISEEILNRYNSITRYEELVNRE